MDKTITTIGGFNISQTKASKTIAFHNDNSEQIGCLSWEDGVFKFEGKAEESAKVFFDWMNTFLKENING